jgi:hypothetical protein
VNALRDRVPGNDGARGHRQVPAHLEGAGFDHRRHPAVAARVAGEVAGSAGQAHAAGVEGPLEGGRIAHQEVRRRGRAGYDVRREPGLLDPGITAPIAHSANDPVQRLRGGKITLTDHPEHRV